MSKEMLNELGQINIADEVIGIIAGKAASECYGLVGMASRRLQDGIAQLLGQDNLNRGVEVSIGEDGVNITLYIIVQYGVKISEVAHNVMERVRYTLDSMVGLHINKINIVVQGVRVVPKQKKQESKKRVVV
ncbi:MAG: Asp23/Gls24 family envelope stress response protein [Firmicutes bacterium]|nr:Asp23/Gls24 family envelope stress response protein [Bacillota bacterium]HOB21329.1 Asp23/Gls24 family envelope stress response protein [Bacillota bacterium]